MMEYGVIRDFDGDIWVKILEDTWVCATDASVRSLRLAELKDFYGPLEYLRWVQAVE
jgi:hypothetical protein